MALAYSLFIGSLVYIWEDYKDLWLFLQIVGLPAIYYIGYEILMDKQRETFEKGFNLISIRSFELEKENQELKRKLKEKKN